MNYTTYRRLIDNNMKSSGDIDYDTKKIRVNKKRSKGEKGGILDTIVHEETHRLNPKMSESNVKRKTTKKLGTMGGKRKRKLYGLY
jgi:hypothetical protein